MRTPLQNAIDRWALALVTDPARAAASGTFRRQRAWHVLLDARRAATAAMHPGDAA